MPQQYQLLVMCHLLSFVCTAAASSMKNYCTLVELFITQYLVSLLTEMLVTYLFCCLWQLFPVLNAVFWGFSAERL